jgi:hypothetical protein
MKVHRSLGQRLFSLSGVGIAFIAFVSAMLAQDTSKTESKLGAASKKAQVERGEVVYVSGNELVVKMQDGEVRHFNVPDSARATVEGKELSVHELKPGMKLERTITTTTTPRTVTTVRTIQGKVFNVSPPNSVILTLPDGTNKQYKIPKNQKFTIGGEEGKSAFELRKGMNIVATVMTEVPETLVAEQRRTTGSAPPPPPTPPLEGALLIEAPAPASVPSSVAAAPAPPAPAAAAPEPPPAKLPSTASGMPLIGLLGLLCSSLSIGIRLMRRG